MTEPSAGEDRADSRNGIRASAVNGCADLAAQGKQACLLVIIGELSDNHCRAPYLEWRGTKACRMQGYRTAAVPAGHVCGWGVPDALRDPIACGHVVNRPDLAALDAARSLLQALPPLVHIQQGLSLGEDPVVFGRSGQPEHCALLAQQFMLVKQLLHDLAG